MAQTVEHFESEICERCGGTGEYSYNQLDGTRCYGCNGAKFRLTQRGREARDAYHAANSDTIRAGDMRDGQVFVRSDGRKLRVQRVEHGDFGSARGSNGGVAWEKTINVAIITGVGKNETRHLFNEFDDVNRWSLRVELPPVMVPGTNRAGEMLRYYEHAATVAEQVHSTIGAWNE